LNEKKIVVFLCLVFFCFHGALQSHPQDDHWQTVETPPFRIHFTKSDAFYAKELESLFHIANDELTRKLHLKLQPSIDVYLCANNRDFMRLTGNMVPHWGEGIANPVKNLIVIKSPNLTNNYDGQKQLVLHELVHILVGKWSRVPPPRWFNEGIAMYFSNDHEFAKGEALSKALISDSVIPLDEIDDVLQFQKTKARLAYEESYLFVKFLVDKYGLERLTNLIFDLHGNGSFEKIFASRYPADMFDMELQWYDVIKKKYRWRFLVDFDIYIWIFILLVFILVAVSVKIRNRKTIKKWEEEDNFASDP